MLRWSHGLLCDDGHPPHARKNEVDSSLTNGTGNRRGLQELLAIIDGILFVCECHVFYCGTHRAKNIGDEAMYPRSKKKSGDEQRASNLFRHIEEHAQVHRMTQDNKDHFEQFKSGQFFHVGPGPEKTWHFDQHETFFASLQVDGTKKDNFVIEISSMARQPHQPGSLCLQEGANAKERQTLSFRSHHRVAGNDVHVDGGSS